MIVFNIVFIFIMLLPSIYLIFSQKSENINSKDVLIAIGYPIILPFLYILVLLKLIVYRIIHFLDTSIISDMGFVLLFATPLIGYLYYNLFIPHLISLFTVNYTNMIECFAALLAIGCIALINVGVLVCYYGLSDFNKRLTKLFNNE